MEEGREKVLIVENNHPFKKQTEATSSYHKCSQFKTNQIEIKVIRNGH